MKIYIISLCLFVLCWCNNQININKLQEQNFCTTNPKNQNCIIESWTWLDDSQTNIYGQKLDICGKNPVTWFQRDWYCKTWPNDPANHSVCAVVDSGFLIYTQKKWNDLINPSWSFPWLMSWDRRCLCAARRYEAYQNWFATKIVKNSTNKTALDVIPKYILEQ